MKEHGEEQKTTMAIMKRKKMSHKMKMMMTLLMVTRGTLILMVMTLVRKKNEMKNKCRLKKKNWKTEWQSLRKEK